MTPREIAARLRARAESEEALAEACAWLEENGGDAEARLRSGQRLSVAIIEEATERGWKPAPRLATLDAETIAREVAERVRDACGADIRVNVSTGYAYIAHVDLDAIIRDVLAKHGKELP